MKTLFSVIVAAITFSALTALGASQYKIKKEDISKTNSSQTIQYPVLASHVVPAAALINTHIRQYVIDGECGPSEDDRSYYYDGRADVETLNQKYITFSLSSDSDCGGAHPNYYSGFVTFNSQTGEILNMDKEVPNQDTSGDQVDWDKWEQHRRELAQILLVKIKSSKKLQEIASCYDKNLSDEENLETLYTLSPYLAAPGKNKTIIVNTAPIHAMTPCGFSTGLKLPEVKKYLAPNSILHDWLK